MAAPDPVIIVDYDPAWPNVFQFLRSKVCEVLGEVAVSVEHVGSTSVPGLAAKPIIDIDVVVESRDEIAQAISRLAKIGYVHLGDLGIPGREAFSAPPNTPEHHLYVCAREAAELRRHLAFRDYLRRNPAAARQYAELKRGLAHCCGTDRDAYTQAKTGFITGILDRANQPSA